MSIFLIASDRKPISSRGGPAARSVSGTARSLARRMAPYDVVAHAAPLRCAQKRTRGAVLVGALAREKMLGDDHPLNFARAFADLAQLDVSQIPLDVELADVAVSPKDLHGDVAGFGGRRTGK
jgi:hypothetical protein